MRSASTPATNARTNERPRMIHRRRSIQAHLVTEAVHFCLRRVQRDQDRSRIAGKKGEAEDDRGHPQEDKRAMEQPLPEIEHQRRLAARYARHHSRQPVRW